MRISTRTQYTNLVSSMQGILEKLSRAQAQGSSGLRIQRPSDDPIGNTRVLSLRQRMLDAERYSGAVDSGLPVLDAAAAALQEGSTSLTRARSLVIQGLNGAMSPEGRATIAEEIDAIREQLISEVGNVRFNGRFLFGGTGTSTEPFVEELVGGVLKTKYVGNNETQTVQIGESAFSTVNIPGSEIFGKQQAGPTEFSGLTGVKSGQTADFGTGYENLSIRHTSTDPGALASVGITLAGGGADDTLLGDNTLVIDAVAGTAQLGNGPIVNLPGTASPQATDVVVRNELGGAIRLDVTGFTGADLTTTVRGEGEISMDGTNFVPLDFVNNDLELVNDASGSVLHVDTTDIKAANQEAVIFSGTVNLFDALQGLSDDLRNANGLSQPDLQQRMTVFMDELDRSQDNLLTGLSNLGARSARFSTAGDRLAGVSLQLEALLSSVEDADFNEVVSEIAQNSSALQMVQATGARILQNSLLNFI